MAFRRRIFTDARRMSATGQHQLFYLEMPGWLETAKKSRAYGGPLLFYVKSLGNRPD